jgi:hypothetical protein
VNYTQFYTPNAAELQHYAKHINLTEEITATFQTYTETAVLSSDTPETAEITAMFQTTKFKLSQS